PVEIVWIALESWIDFKNHSILVSLGVDRRNLALTEGIVKRVIDVLDAHTKPRRRQAVNHNGFLQPALLAIGADIGETGYSAHALQHLLGRYFELGQIRPPQGELILRLARPGAGAEVLGRH